MGAWMPDVRNLVPRMPPEGLREWTVQEYAAELDRGGLLYEAEYVDDYGMAQLLDPWAKPRKVKMVRCSCSVCGQSILLNWCKDQTHGYGFVHPEDEEGDWARTPTAAGDETKCPICGHAVLVNKAAAVGRGYYVTAETSVLSAALVGESNMLALTGWTVQRRVYRSGSDRLEIIPAEAYVFSSDGCAQLLGWRNSYGGTAGCFISYSREWRQPLRWSEHWGASNKIFGLTPELVERSCLPNCKLDVYMKGYPGQPRYPVPYLRLYQTRPNVEHVLVHGLPRVLHDLIKGEVQSRNWEKNVRGLMALEDLDWDESRPAQMLRLNKDELRLARAQDCGLLFWRLFTDAREEGEILSGEDIQNAFCLGDDNVANLVGQGPVGKSIRYLLRQCEVIGVEGDDEDPEPEGVPDVTTLLDYWRMARALGRNLDDPSVRFPKDLLNAHDRASELVEQRWGIDNFAPQFRLRRRLLSKYSFRADGLLIRPARSQRELTAEGNALHHCVGTYGQKHASGDTAIFFIRRAKHPGEPYFTLELDEKELQVRQNRGMRNCGRTEEVQAFEEKWLSWLRAGCPRDSKGRPVVNVAKRKVDAA